MIGYWAGEKMNCLGSPVIRLTVLRNIIDWHCMQNHAEEDIE